MSRLHPGWSLLRADHAPLVASFLHRLFVAPNRRLISQADLVEALEDELFTLRESLGEGTFPRSAADYLNDWADDEKGWLRKFYPQGEDEPHFDLTPSAEKALSWLEGLTERTFVGTESRLLTLFELLRQICQGSESDPEARLRELERRREAIDEEMERVRAGEMALLDDTALRDRFQQFVGTARELLADFREVEQNFRRLDREVREKIALWRGTKGELLEEIMGRRDAIVDSDQGRSFRAFWDFLMSPSRQEELTALLDRTLTLEAIQEMGPDERLRRVHYDWLEAGEHTQRTVGRLSRELRRFLDDKAWLENRRIVEILHDIEAQALALRDSHPRRDLMELDEASPTVTLPFERPLFTPPERARLVDLVVEEGEEAVDLDLLFSAVFIDRISLIDYISEALRARPQVTLAELVEGRPLRQGLLELMTYFQLASEVFLSAIDEEVTDQVSWQSEGRSRRATFRRVIFVRR